MNLLKTTLILAACLAALGTLACVEAGYWDEDHRTADRRYDDRRDDDWSDRQGSWDDRRDGDWDQRRDARGDDRREGYWDRRRDGNWAGQRDDAYWSQGKDRYTVPRPVDMRSIQILASSLNQSLDEMTKGLDPRYRSSGSHTYRVAGLVEELRSSAREFQRQVEANMNRPGRTITAYRQLKASHARFDAESSRRDYGKKAERQMDRIKRIVGDIDRHYMRRS